MLRIGRTGRAGKEGIAISFVLPADFKHLQRIERYIGQRLQLLHASIDGSVQAQDSDTASKRKPVIRNKSDFSPKSRSSDRFESGDREQRFKRSYSNSNEGTGEKRRSRSERSDKDSRFKPSYANSNESSGEKRRSRPERTERDSRFKPSYANGNEGIGEKRRERSERADKDSRFKPRHTKTNETQGEKRREKSTKTDAKFDQPRKVKSQGERFERKPKTTVAPKKKSWANDSQAPRGEKGKWKKRANEKARA